jgi:hypothetical protein
VETYESPNIYERIIHHDLVKDNQVRLTLNNFRDVEYLHLRKYYLDFDEEWKPTKEGIAIPIDLTNVTELFTGLVEILSLAESREVIIKHFSELVNTLYQD